MFTFSERLNAMSASETLAMSQKSSELRARGIDVINLSVGEPDFNTPDHIKQAAKEAIDNNFSFYSPVAGYLSLREAICQKLKTENSLNFTPEQISCSNGAKQSVCNVIMAIVGQGDEVIIPAPYWVSYPEMVKLADGKSVIIPASIHNDFKITPAQLRAAITERTKAIIICSPSNPTGSVYSKDELKALADVLAEHKNIVIISDEIYEHINYNGQHSSIAQFDNVFEQTVIVNGVSKCYAMTGWRLGWIAAPLAITKACNKLQGQYTSGPCSITQKAAETAYRGDQTCIARMQQAFERRRDLTVELASQIEGFKVNKPQGAFYVFPDVSYYFGKKLGNSLINNASELSMYLLENAHVACVGGAAFGEPNCLRLSYATSDENISEAFRRIKNALK
jgi:aspartate aminotransferase